jgi:hypothetical protein
MICNSQIPYSLPLTRGKKAGSSCAQTYKGRLTPLKLPTTSLTRLLVWPKVPRIFRLSSIRYKIVEAIYRRS